MKKAKYYNINNLGFVFERIAKTFCKEQSWTWLGNEGIYLFIFNSRLKDHLV